MDITKQHQEQPGAKRFRREICTDNVILTEDQYIKVFIKESV